MSGTKGHSGRKPGTTIKGKAERDQLIIGYWRQGHALRTCARVFRMSPAGIAKVVKGLSRETGETTSQEVTR